MKHCFAGAAGDEVINMTAQPHRHHDTPDLAQIGAKDFTGLLEDGLVSFGNRMRPEPASRH